MVFLHEIVAMPNNCNLSCSYCDWPKQKIEELSEDEKNTAKRHFEKIHALGDGLFGECRLIGYTGGEPLVYKELVYLLLETYHDKWVRINTNGLQVDSDVINHLKAHGKSYLSISLDGNSFEQNQNRFSKEAEFNSVLENIDKVLEQGICVQVMCTINPLNIDTFIDYAWWLSERYAAFIADGSLIMSAHFIQTYGKKREVPSPAQRKNLADKLTEDDVPEIISKARWHYRRLAKYLLTLANEGCRAYDWARWTNFLGRDLVTNGDFKTFACGMYGMVEGNGLNINDPEIINSFKKIHKEISGIFLSKNSHYNCITDWNAIDSILNGDVELSDAQAWFKMFRDENIVSWLEQAKNESRAFTASSL